MNLKPIETTDPDIARTMVEELDRQQNTIELIASENFTSPAVMAVQAGFIFNGRFASSE